MSAIPLEERVASLEAEMAFVKKQLPLPAGESPNKNDWLKTVWGSFADDPMHDEAMRLGREYRETLRLVPRKKTNGEKSG